MSDCKFGKWLLEGNMIYALQPCTWPGKAFAENRWWASVQRGRGCTEAETEVIAAKMRAAPDLYEALDSILSEHQEPDVNGYTDITVPNELMEKARAALAKAGGEKT